MKPIRFLPGIHHQTRAFIFMFGALVFYCLWLWLWGALGVVDTQSSSLLVGTLLLLPLVPMALFDLALRLTWQQETPTLYPPPPSRLECLFLPEYGLFWFPMLIMIPLWVWGMGLIVGVAFFV